MFILETITLQCGETELVIDSMIPSLVTTIINVIKIGVPILLIIFGMLDLGRAVMAQKEDEIKKGWQTFIKRMIAAAVVFFVVVIVQLVFNLVAGGNNDENKENMWNCIDCFINYSYDKCAK